MTVHVFNAELTQWMRGAGIDTTYAGMAVVTVEQLRGLAERAKRATIYAERDLCMQELQTAQVPCEASRRACILAIKRMELPGE